MRDHFNIDANNPAMCLTQVLDRSTSCADQALSLACWLHACCLDWTWPCSQSGWGACNGWLGSQAHDRA